MAEWLKVQAIFNEMQILSQCQPFLKCEVTTGSGIADCQEASEIRNFKHASERVAPRSEKKTAWPIDQAVPTIKVSIFYALGMSGQFPFEINHPQELLHYLWVRRTNAAESTTG